MIVYTEHISPRLKFIANFILGELLGVEFSITTNINELKQSEQAGINYSSNRELPGFQITPHGLLSETGIIQREIPVDGKGEFTVFFKTDGKDLDFDIFSAAFYLISRYEEYGFNDKDRYGRYKSCNSLAFQNNFLQLPIVNIWTEKLRTLLIKRFPDLNHAKNPASYLLSIDIDNPWAHLNKSYLRLFGGLMKSLTVGRWSAFRERLSVMRGREKDPFDTYDFIRKHHSDKLLMFILIGEKGKYDNKVKIGNQNWRKLIKDLSHQFKLGLHPSFYSNSSINILKNEKHTLDEIMGQVTTRSRQHFLLMDFPSTFENLITIGVKNDYSMGYADQIGFRAGTSSSFNFYNLEKEDEADLRITPFCVMDRSLKDYMKMNPEESFMQMTDLMDKIEKYGGEFVSIWHNESFSGKGEWKDWDHLYIRMIKELNRKFAL